MTLTFLPSRSLLALVWAVLPAAAALAQAAQPPLVSGLPPSAASASKPVPATAASAPLPGDTALGEQMSHCAAVLYEVQRQTVKRRLAMNASDATALMRYTMLASAALLGEKRGFAEVKARQSQLYSKLTLTREENINHLLNSEAGSCIEAVESNKAALNARVARLPAKP